MVDLTESNEKENIGSHTIDEILKNYSVIKMDGENIDSITEKVNEAKKFNPNVAIIGAGAGNMALVQTLIESQSMKDVKLVVTDIDEKEKTAIHKRDLAFADMGRTTFSHEKGELSELFKAEATKIDGKVRQIQKYLYDFDELNKPEYGRTKNRKNGGNKKIKKRKKARNGRGGKK